MLEPVAPICKWLKQFDVYTQLVYTTRLVAAPEWRNWQTRTTQNRVSYALVGSIPTSGIQQVTL